MGPMGRNAINHTIKVTVLGLTGITVIDTNPPDHEDTQTLVSNANERNAEVSAITSFSRNKTTITSLPSRPIITCPVYINFDESDSSDYDENQKNKEEGKDDAATKPVSEVRYMAIWGYDHDMNEEGSVMVVQTNLHPEKDEVQNGSGLKKKISPRLSEKFRLSTVRQTNPKFFQNVYGEGHKPKAFDITVGLVSGEEAVVLATSTVTICGSEPRLEVKLPIREVSSITKSYLEEGLSLHLINEDKRDEDNETRDNVESKKSRDGTSIPNGKRRDISLRKSSLVPKKLGILKRLGKLRVTNTIISSVPKDNDIQQNFSGTSSIATSDNYRKQSVIATESFAKKTPVATRSESTLNKKQKDFLDKKSEGTAPGVCFRNNPSRLYSVAQDSYLRVLLEIMPTAVFEKKRETQFESSISVLGDAESYTIHQPSVTGSLNKESFIGRQGIDNPSRVTGKNSQSSSGKDKLMNSSKSNASSSSSEKKSASRSERRVESSSKSEKITQNSNESEPGLEVQIQSDEVRKKFASKQSSKTLVMNNTTSSRNLLNDSNKSSREQIGSLKNTLQNIIDESNMLQGSEKYKPEQAEEKEGNGDNSVTKLLDLCRSCQSSLSNEVLTDDEGDDVRAAPEQRNKNREEGSYYSGSMFTDSYNENDTFVTRSTSAEVGRTEHVPTIPPIDENTDEYDDDEDDEDDSATEDTLTTDHGTDGPSQSYVNDSVYPKPFLQSLFGKYNCSVSDCVFNALPPYENKQTSICFKNDPTIDSMQQTISVENEKLRSAVQTEERLSLDNSYEGDSINKDIDNADEEIKEKNTAETSTYFESEESDKNYGEGGNTTESSTVKSVNAKKTHDLFDIIESTLKNIDGFGSNIKKLFDKDKDNENDDTGNIEKIDILVGEESDKERKETREETELIQKSFEERDSILTGSSPSISFTSTLFETSLEDDETLTFMDTTVNSQMESVLTDILSSNMSTSYSSLDESSMLMRSSQGKRVLRPMINNRHTIEELGINNTTLTGMSDFNASRDARTYEEKRSDSDTDIRNTQDSNREGSRPNRGIYSDFVKELDRFTVMEERFSVEDTILGNTSKSQGDKYNFHRHSSDRDEMIQVR